MLGLFHKETCLVSWILSWSQDKHSTVRTVNSFKKPKRQNPADQRQYSSSWITLLKVGSWCALEPIPCIKFHERKWNPEAASMNLKALRTSYKMSGTTVNFLEGRPQPQSNQGWAPRQQMSNLCSRWLISGEGWKGTTGRSKPLRIFKSTLKQTHTCTHTYTPAVQQRNWWATRATSHNMCASLTQKSERARPK